jgi:hypothetical protein
MSVNDPGCVKTQCPAVMILPVHGCDALPDQNAPKGSRRDGPLGAGIQFDTGHEHRRDQAADRCDPGLRPKGHGFSQTSQEGRFYTAKT